MNKDVRAYGIQLTELPLIISRVEDRYKKIKTKFPGIRAYLVFALRGEQAKLKDAPASIFSEFKTFFVEGKARDNAWDCLQQKMTLERDLKRQDKKETPKDRARIAALAQDLEEKVSKLEINVSANIEIRFDDLDYEIIRALRGDALVDRDLTPQIGGIRIVLGTIWDFSEGWTD